MLKAVDAVLAKAGYLVLDARSGTSALARMKGISGPAVAVIDLVMPTMDGWELIAQMKKDPGLALMPIIVCTAHGSGQVDGAWLVLNKPVSVPAILAAVRESFEAISGR